MYFGNFLRRIQEKWEKDAETTYYRMLTYSALSAFGRREVWEKLKKTCKYIHKEYAGHTRISGEKLYDHVMQSVDVLMMTHPDIVSVQLCLLHEVLTLDKTKKNELENLFGEDVAVLVENFYNLGKVRYVAQENLHEDEEQKENLKKMLMVLAVDVRVLLVKLSTRLEGMSSLVFLPEEKRKRIAHEVLEIYGPVASRLGIYTMKTKLEDAAYKILEPDTYQKIKHDLEDEISQNTDIIEICQTQIQQLLKVHKIRGNVYGRIKSIYSIASKLKLKKRDHVSELYDIFALRVIVPTKEDCYRIFGYIHERSFPIAKRIKDYISLPKVNHYQSLHTTVTGLYPKNPDRPVEIQIRTPWMDDVAEYGVASHVEYKEQKKVDDTSWKAKLDGLKKLFIFHGQFTGEAGSDLVTSVSQILVFTEDNKVKTLPKDATVLDYSFALGKENGLRSIRGFVNNIEVPLFYVLHSGDTVRIETMTGHVPSGIWLLYATTPFARQAINEYFLLQRKSINTHEVISSGEELRVQKEKLLIGGDEGISYEFADCCHAQRAYLLHGPLVAYVGTHHTIKVHAADCERIDKIKDQHRDQIIEVTYER